MFGYLIASAGNLTEPELKRYKACYCGLCRSLKARHGELSRFTLNYDMTFLVLLLESLYEPVESFGCDRCLAHPRQKRDWFRSDISDYAADMNVALSYLKCLDNWQDEGNPAGLLEARALKKAYLEIKQRHPKQVAAMEQGIFELNALEKANVEDADAAAASFGHLMGAVFAYKEDRWTPTLYAMGDNLGRFIYIMDAVIDLDADTRNNCYNPFRRYYGQDKTELYMSILKIFLSETVREFDSLPLVQDVSILKNILCSGLWSRFEAKYGPLQSPGSQPAGD